MYYFESDVGESSRKALAKRLRDIAKAIEAGVMEGPDWHVEIMPAMCDLMAARWG